MYNNKRKSLFTSQSVYNLQTSEQSPSCRTQVLAKGVNSPVGGRKIDRAPHDGWKYPNKPPVVKNYKLNMNMADKKAKSARTVHLSNRTCIHTSCVNFVAKTVIKLTKRI